MSNYIPIDKGGPITEQIQRGFKQEEVTLEQQPGLETNEQPAEQQVSASPEQVVHKEKQKVHRSQKRIKQLLERDREKDARIAQLEDRLTQTETNTASQAISLKKELASALESNIRTMNAQLINAMRANDPDLSESIVALQSDISKAQLQLASLGIEIKNAPQPQQRQPQPQQRPEAPERALEWIEEHPEFRTDALFQNMVISLNNQLLQAGWNAEDDAFYEYIDAQVSKRFPEYYAQPQQTVVVQEETPVELSQSSIPEPRVPSPVQKRPTTVSGASRSPGAVIKPKQGEVVITEDMIRRSEGMGVPLDRMAKRMNHIETNRRPDGYVPIKMKRDTGDNR